MAQGCRARDRCDRCVRHGNQQGPRPPTPAPRAALGPSEPPQTLPDLRLGMALTRSHLSHTKPLVSHEATCLTRSHLSHTKAPPPVLPFLLRVPYRCAAAVSVSDVTRVERLYTDSPPHTKPLVTGRCALRPSPLHVEGTPPRPPSERPASRAPSPVLARACARGGGRNAPCRLPRAVLRTEQARRFVRNA